MRKLLHICTASSLGLALVQCGTCVLLPSQSVLNLMGNQVIRYIQNYRKNFICDIVSDASPLLSYSPFFRLLPHPVHPTFLYMSHLHLPSLFRLPLLPLTFFPPSPCLLSFLLPSSTFLLLFFSYFPSLQPFLSSSFLLPCFPFLLLPFPSSVKINFHCFYF